MFGYSAFHCKKLLSFIYFYRYIGIYIISPITTSWCQINLLITCQILWPPPIQRLLIVQLYSENNLAKSIGSNLYSPNINWLIDIKQLSNQLQFMNLTNQHRYFVSFLCLSASLPFDDGNTQDYYYYYYYNFVPTTIQSKFSPSLSHTASLRPLWAYRKRTNWTKCRMRRKRHCCATIWHSNNTNNVRIHQPVAQIAHYPIKTATAIWMVMRQSANNDGIVQRSPVFN